MEDRYELRGSIGQGGIGRVFRAFDHRVQREVAIKRILVHQDDPTFKDEATKQLMAEAGALAALQHPNIITVHDVGADDDGPYIVMELIAGKTLDQVIEQAPLDWDDFKRVVTQSLEALIAAQELNLIHCDLKPPNIMLSWLPSGTFQVKIVDFGLATLIQNQSPEQIAAMDSVFGSIFFMPPEQFERSPLDARSDMYSLGCCLYQALAGSYPFTGTTAGEVMEAHLSHQVIPLQKIRRDLPPWACQWVMWLINRQPDDRPASARDALANFVWNERKPTVAASPAVAPNNPRPVQTVAPLSAARLASVPLAATSGAAASGSQLLPLGSTTDAISGPTIAADAGHLEDPIKGMRPLMIAGGAALGLAMLATLVVFLIKRQQRIDQHAAFEQVAIAASGAGLTPEQRQLVFDYIRRSAPGDSLERACSLLQQAARDTSIDHYASILDFITAEDLPEGVRATLFQNVLGGSCRVESIPGILEFCTRTRNPAEALAAFESVSPIMREQDSGSLVAIISTTPSGELRQAAEFAAARIIRSSANKSLLAGILADAKAHAKPAAVAALDRLLIVAQKNS